MSTYTVTATVVIRTPADGTPYGAAREMVARIHGDVDIVGPMVVEIEEGGNAGYRSLVRESDLR